MYDRILLALQFWEGDRHRASELARFITDWEPVPRTDADFLLSARFDTAPDPETVAYVGRRFNVYTSIGKSQLKGHPAGSYGLWHDTLYAASKLPRTYDCVLTFEADCTPLTRDWITKLREAWREVIRRVPSAHAAGHEWHAAEYPWPHINGNMLISGDPLRLLKMASWRGVPTRAWDVEIYDTLRAWGCSNTPAIRSLYVRKTKPGFLGYLAENGCVFLHGDKDGSARKLAKQFVTTTQGFPVASNPMIECANMEDPIPSVFDQLKGFEIKFPGETVRRYNPGLAHCPQGGWWLAYRHLNPCGWHSTVRLAKLDGAGSVVSDRPMSGFEEKIGGMDVYFEDPRLFALPDGGLGMSWVQATYGAWEKKTDVPARSWTQHYGTIDPDNARVAPRALIPFGRQTGGPADSEKNWGFFSAKNELHFLYEFNPFTVVRVRGTKSKVFRMAPKELGEWAAEYGVPAGGAPPIEVAPGKFVAFFHSWAPHPERVRRYHWGALEFEFRATNFDTHVRITRVTRVPIASGSERDGFLWPRGACFWEPIVVFPTGAHFNPASRTWTATAGINDARCGFFQFSSEDLEKFFSRRPESR